MVIHSVTPMQVLMVQNDTIEPVETKQVPGGYLEGRGTPRGFQVTGVWSTDPSVYLRYGPGSLYRE